MSYNDMHMTCIKRSKRWQAFTMTTGFALAVEAGVEEAVTRVTVVIGTTCTFFWSEIKNIGISRF